MGRLSEFFRGVLREIRKTSWPKRKELFKYTVTVVVTVALLVVFFAILDKGFSEIIERITNMSN